MRGGRPGRPPQRPEDEPRWSPRRSPRRPPRRRGRRDGNGPPSAETFEVRRPHDGTLLERPGRLARERVREVARVRAAQPAWEESASTAAAAGSSACETGSSTTRTGLDDRMQAEAGKVRADAALEAFYLLDAINFYCERGPRYLADEIVSPHMPLLRPSGRRSSTGRSRSSGSSAPGTSR